jgi:F0F1-type ATP synthase assembly protein I
MTATMPPSAPDQTKLDTMSSVRVLGLAGEIGYLIAIPAALFGFGGAYIDKTLDTSPLFIIAGLTVALATSMLAIWHRIKPLLQS